MQSRRIVLLASVGIVRPLPVGLRVHEVRIATDCGKVGVKPDGLG